MSKGAFFCLCRFEMPYNIWCDGCKNHIGMGEFAPTPAPASPAHSALQTLKPVNHKCHPHGTLPVRSQGGDGAQVMGRWQTPYRRVVRRPGSGFTS